MNSNRLRFRIPPANLVLLVLTYAASCGGEVLLALRDQHWTSSVPLVAADGLIAALLAWKMLHRHLLRNAFRNLRNNKLVLVGVCPVAVAVIGAAYLLKAIGLASLAIFAQEPRCLLESLNEFSLVFVLISRVVRRQRMSSGRLPLPGQTRPSKPQKSKIKRALEQSPNLYL